MRLGRLRNLSRLTKDRGGQPTSTPENVGQLRVVTLNLQYGQPAQGWPAGASLRERVAAAREALDRTVEQLRALNPDILALQEVDKGQRRSGYLPQAEFIMNQLGLKFWRMNAMYAGSIFGMHWRVSNPAIPNVNGHGVVLGSRYPARSWHYKRLGRAWPRIAWRAVAWPGFSMGLLHGLRSLPSALKGLRIYPGIMRVLGAAVLLTPFGRVAVGVTHLETAAAVAAGQARRAWRSVLGLNAQRCLLAGDMNLSPEQVEQALELLDEGFHPALHGGAPSYPADNPTHSLDQLLANGFVLAGEPTVHRLAVSDHCAVVYDLIPA